ncbi:dual specificity protein phosphatase 4-like [Mercenaria mercenaria]|uniref:dual specificity protein phosphatase 4-like n=1 Tax=Mercenaria mercenaria TaxID=6596 RepID=UPI00234ED50B|nr:dual specificity protein phosphatase 4-like [Mercenaria mercenaria]
MPMEVNKLSPAQLKQLIDSQVSSKLLLLDFRSFLLYNNDRIKGAVNAFCPSILKRRFAATGCLRLESVLTPEIRKKLRNGDYTKLVLYDNDDTVRESSDLAVVIQGLKHDRYSFNTVSVLKGGFHTFRLKYPLHCIGHKGPRDTSTCAISKLSPVKSSRKLSANEFKHAPTQLMPHLYIGNERNSLDTDLLQQLGITAILNVSTMCSSHVKTGFEYKCIPVRDNESENISCWFNEALHFIETIRKQEGIVLVHCRAGISRSATICIAYLMTYQSFTLDQAFEFVRARREIISPNMNFMQQLYEFERMLLVKRMSAIVYPAVHEIKSPLSCSQTTERSPVVVSSHFNFNVCAQI